MAPAASQNAMKHIRAPEPLDIPQGHKSVFLAGSIDMGAAENWQERIAKELEHLDVTILNPRRLKWETDWKQTGADEKLREQVTWELDALERSDLAIFYFQAGSTAPITLLEMGLMAGRHPHKVIVCCPDGYWRKGNVDITCQYYGVRTVPGFNALVLAIRDWADE